MSSILADQVKQSVNLGNIIRYEVQDISCKVRGTRCEIRGDKYEIRGASCEVQDTGSDTRYKARGARSSTRYSYTMPPMTLCTTPGRHRFTIN